MEAAMGLMRRMPPKHSETALSALLSLIPNHSADLLSQVDQPLQVLYDVDCGKEFILCEYNRDADSYRSPWSSKYYPPLEDGTQLSARLRKLEVDANEIFSVYRDRYYEGGISSVYIWEDDNEGFVVCFLIKKDVSKTGHGKRGYLEEGAWEAIHVVQVGPEEDGRAHYCLTSTIMLSLTTDKESSGTFGLSGSIRQQMNLDLSVAEGHMCNMGRMIEEMESKLRNSLDQLRWACFGLDNLLHDAVSGLGLFRQDEKNGLHPPATRGNHTNEDVSQELSLREKRREGSVNFQVSVL